jgi:N-acetyl-gamma-glutamyl-phosphate reductase
MSTEDLRELYRDAYAGHPFVEVVEAPPSLRAVQRTNYAQVCPVADPRGGRVTLFGAIDNLGKGAAGQAVQNLNLMAGLAETEGLR